MSQPWVTMIPVMAADLPAPDPPTTRAFRFSVAAGALTPARIRERQVVAEHQRVGLLTVLSEPERLHLELVKKTLRPGATWEDAVAAILRHGSAGS